MVIRAWDTQEVSVATGQQGLTVLLPGWGMTPDVYADCADRLGGRGSVLTPPTWACDGLWNLPGAVKTLARTIEDDGRVPAVVVGHSLGGALGIALAHCRPDLVAELVLVDAVGIPQHGRSPDSWLAGGPSYVGSVALRTVLRLIIGSFQDPRRIVNWISAAAWALHADLESVLPAVGARTPTTVVWGETDRMIPLEAGERMAQLLGARLVVVAGDHDWPLRQPGRFASLLLSIVEDTRMEVGLQAVPPSA